MAIVKGYKQNAPLLDRIKDKYNINETTGCWEWNNWTNDKGYGEFSIKKRKVLAHRASYMAHNNLTELPKGMYVCHTCDNPPCINPNHLFLGTQQDNMDDMYNKGRRKKAICGETVTNYLKGCRCKACIIIFRQVGRANYHKRKIKKGIVTRDWVKKSAYKDP
jgi:hypothetical protein